jgi:hypothetical protein
MLHEFSQLFRETYCQHLEDRKGNLARYQREAVSTCPLNICFDGGDKNIYFTEGKEVSSHAP